MVDDPLSLRGKSVVAVITYHDSIIYPTDAIPGQRPERIVASDPQGRFHKVHHHGGNPDGSYEGDNNEYWRELTDVLAPAGEILLLGHGRGKANASHRWVSYAEQHRSDVAAKVVADVRVDVDALDERQLLRFAQYYLNGPAVRDFGDGRWGQGGSSTI